MEHTTCNRNRITCQVQCKATASSFSCILHLHMAQLPLLDYFNMAEKKP
jgi:hypothetical protein